MSPRAWNAPAAATARAATACASWLPALIRSPWTHPASPKPKPPASLSPSARWPSYPSPLLSLAAEKSSKSARRQSWLKPRAVPPPTPSASAALTICQSTAVTTSISRSPIRKSSAITRPTREPRPLPLRRRIRTRIGRRRQHHHPLRIERLPRRRLRIPPQS